MPHAESYFKDTPTLCCSWELNQVICAWQQCVGTIFVLGVFSEISDDVCELEFSWQDGPVLCEI